MLKWSYSRRLKLQGAKTEFIIIDRAGLLCTEEDFIMQIDGVNIKSVNTVRDLGVILDSRFNMKSHITKVSRACFFHLRRLRQIRSCLDEDSAKTVAVTMVLSRLDYCNAILTGLPETTLQPLTRVLNTAARIVLKLDRRDHITQALRSLHWLPIRERIKFKLCLMMHNIVNKRSPSYLNDMVTPCFLLHGTRELRSGSSFSFAMRRTRLKFGDRAFSVAGPNAWNGLPVPIRVVQNTRSFKRQLKTLLFEVNL